MTRRELLEAIDLSFERYVDHDRTLEQTRSEIRMTIDHFCDEITDICEGMNRSLSATLDLKEPV